MRLATLAVPVAPFALTTVALAQATPFDQSGTVAFQAFGSSVSTVTLTPPFPNARPEEVLAISSGPSGGNTARVELWRFNEMNSTWVIDAVYQSRQGNAGNSAFGASMDLRGERTSPTTIEYEGIIGDPNALASSGVAPGAATVITPSTPTGMNLPGDFFGLGIDQLGTSVAYGDVTGDGVPEYIVGSPSTIAGGPGRIDIFDSTLALVGTVPGPSAGSLFGTSVAYLGDTDNDGFGDYVVGAPFAGFLLQGAAFVYSGLSTSPSTTIMGDLFTNSGQTVGNIGDIDGDQIDDFYVGEPLAGASGRIQIYGSAPGTMPVTVTPAGTGQAPPLGTLVAAGKDLDGDSIPDLAVPATTLGDLIAAYSGVSGALIGTIPRDPGDTDAVSSLTLFDADGLCRNQIAVGQSSASISSPPGAGRVRILSIPDTFGYPYCCQPLAAASSAGGFPGVTGGGSVSIAANNLTVTTTGLPTNTIAFHSVGTDPAFVTGFFGGPSTQCFGGTAGSFSIVSAGPSGSITTAVDFEALPRGLDMATIGAGTTLYFQCFFRDVVGSTSLLKLSSARAITLIP
ncbi:MAG: integrin alpha [Planctomycetota bacterium]